MAGGFLLLAATQAHGTAARRSLFAGRINSHRASCLVSVLHDCSSQLQARCSAYACYGFLSSACRGTPFQLELPGPLLPFAQGKPQLPPSLRLPKRHGAYTPAPPGELKAAFFAAAPPINKNCLYRQKGPAAPLALLTRAIHPAFCPIQQAAARRARRSSRGHGDHTRRANHRRPHRGGCRSATAHTHRPRQGKGRRP